MKRSDIKVGQAYYYSRSTKWDEWADGVKAVVVDDERYTVVRSTWGSLRDETPYVQDPKGTGVLVDLHFSTGDIERVAVLAAHLRGPYDETKATVEANVAADRAARQREDVARTDRNRHARQTANAAGDIGVDAYQDYSDDRRVTVPTAQFAAMVDALTAAGWRYQPTTDETGR